MDAAADLRRAQALIEVNRAEDAVKILTPLVAEDPGSIRGWGLLAQCYGALNRPADMLGATERALQAAPDSEWAHRLHAQALVNNRRLAEATRAAAEAVRLAPDLWRTHLSLGSTLVRAKDYRPAWRCAARARELAPDEPSTHALCGDVLNAMADGPAARASYSEALRLDPNHHSARHNLAVLEYHRGRPLVAAEGFGAAIAGDPTVGRYVRNAQLAARALLWRLTDWAALVFVLTLIALVVFDRPGARIVGPVAVVGYALFARRMLRATPPGIRAEMRRLLPRPAYALAVVGVAALVLAVLDAAFVPASAAIAVPLGVPGALFAIVVGFRVRNRLLRSLYRGVRRAFYRIGRAPAR